MYNYIKLLPEDISNLVFSAQLNGIHGRYIKGVTIIKPITADQDGTCTLVFEYAEELNATDGTPTPYVRVA